MRDKAVWIAVLIFFVVGDILTTYIGLSLPFIGEASPIAGPLYYSYGFLPLILLKVGFTGGMYLLWRQIDSLSRMGIPLGLALVGLFATVWNSIQIGMVLMV